MAVTRDQKAAQLAVIKEKLQQAKSAMFVQYAGLSVTDINKFRARLRERNAEMKICKKTILRLAAKDIQAPDIAEDALPGPIACIFSNDDPAAGPSVALAFSKENENVKLIGSIFDGKYLGASESMEFAKIPSRQVLLAIFASMCRAPLVQFASACSSPLSGFARAVAELAKKQPAPVPQGGTAA